MIRHASLLVLAPAIVALSACAEDYAPPPPYPPPPAGLFGPGVPVLLPELRDTARGQRWVRRRFDFNQDGVVQVSEARAANRAFLDRRWGDDDYTPPPPPPPASTSWDREGMRGYGFREGRGGAVFDIGDVLFDFGSARLRPEAQSRLLPLAGYLRSHPAQKARLDGFTDSVGSPQANLALSRARAASVADLLASQGARASQFELDGHGEGGARAPNNTPEGRQLNRRVEVTLIGRRADEFR